MNSQINKLHKSDDQKILKLLKKVNFPGLNLSNNQLKQILDNVENYGIFNNGNLIIWFAIFLQENQYHLDIAVDPSIHKKWANNEIITKIKNIIFSYNQRIYCKPKNKNSLQICKNKALYSKKYNKFYFQQTR